MAGAGAGGGGGAGVATGTSAAPGNAVGETGAAAKFGDVPTVKDSQVEVIGADGNSQGSFGSDGKPVAPNIMLESQPAEKESSLRLARHQVGPNASSWVNTNAQAERDLSDALGLTAKIEDLFAQGRTAQQVTTSLTQAGLLDRVPLVARSNLVVGTRASLGIPSMVSSEDIAEFAAWKAERDKRISTRDAGA